MFNVQCAMGNVQHHTESLITATRFQIVYVQLTDVTYTLNAMGSTHNTHSVYVCSVRILENALFVWN